MRIKCSSFSAFRQRWLRPARHLRSSSRKQTTRPTPANRRPRLALPGRAGEKQRTPQRQPEARMHNGLRLAADLTRQKTTPEPTRPFELRAMALSEFGHHLGAAGDARLARGIHQTIPAIGYEGSIHRHCFYLYFSPPPARSAHQGHGHPRSGFPPRRQSWRDRCTRRCCGPCQVRRRLAAHRQRSWLAR